MIKYGKVKARSVLKKAERTVLEGLRKDRSFTFVIDKLDTDETAQNLQAASALERQVREVVIPEVDTYTYGVMCANAGQKPAAKALTKDNIYLEIIAGNNALDNEEVPETGRIIVVTPDVYVLMKQCKVPTLTGLWLSKCPLTVFPRTSAS